MKHFVFFAAAASFAAFPALSDTVTIGTVSAYDAGNYTIAPEVLQGFEKALGDELCQRAKLTCEWKALPSDQLWPALEAGEVDAAMAGISSDMNVGGSIDMTLPYLMLDPHLHIGLPDTEWMMEGAVVAYLPDPAVTAYGKTTGATFTQYETLDAALDAVRDGKALSLYGEREALLPLVEKSDGKLEVVGKNREVKIKPGVAMAFHADKIDLRFAFEDQIFEMTQDGSLNTLTETWFGVDAAGW